MIKNDFARFLAKQVKFTDKYRAYKTLSQIGRVKEISIVYMNEKILRYEPFSAYSEFQVTINNKFTLTMKIYTNGEFELY